jgi:hypothetical protein
VFQARLQRTAASHCLYAVLGKPALQQSPFGLVRGREPERRLVSTLSLVTPAETAQEVGASRWQQVVADQGSPVECVEFRQAGVVPVAEPYGDRPVQRDHG